jgi:hypothetical protein
MYNPSFSPNWYSIHKRNARFTYQNRIFLANTQTQINDDATKIYLVAFALGEPEVERQMACIYTYIRSLSLSFLYYPFFSFSLLHISKG